MAIRGVARGDRCGHPVVMPPVGAGAPIVPIPMRCAVHVCGACSYVQ